MAVTQFVDEFTPSVNGFRFTNSFPPAPTVRIDLGLLGTVGLGDASQGVCGGMAFAVRDYFEAGSAVPTIDAPPAEGTPLFDFITRRLIDSFHGVTGVSSYLDLMVRPSADLHLIIGSRSGAFSRTVTRGWPEVRADLDAGHPSPLGLVPVHTADVRQIGRCHQVLAYGYDLADDGTVTLHVYDPNTDHATADGVHITFASAHPSAASPINHNINIAESTLHGFFRSHYTAARPPAWVGESSRRCVDLGRGRA